jgi:hypothetical protein
MLLSSRLGSRINLNDSRMIANLRLTGREQGSLLIQWERMGALGARLWADYLLESYGPGDAVMQFMPLGRTPVATECPPRRVPFWVPAVGGRSTGLRQDRVGLRCG